MSDWESKEQMDNFDAAMNNAFDLMAREGLWNEDLWSVKYSDDENGIYEIAFETCLVRVTPTDAEILERWDDPPDDVYEQIEDAGRLALLWEATRVYGKAIRNALRGEGSC